MTSMSSSSVDAVLAQTRKALALPDSTFRTEYDLDNTLAAHIERLDAAAAMAPGRTAEIDELRGLWVERAEAWRANRRRSDAPLATAQDYLAALAAQDAMADEEDDAGDAKGKRKRKTKKDRQAAKAAKAVEEATDDMGARGNSLEMHLAVMRGEAAPNPRAAAGARTGSQSPSRSPAGTPRTAARKQAERDDQERGVTIGMDTLADPPVLEAPSCLPSDVLGSSAAIRLPGNSANAEIVFDVMATVTEEEVEAAVGGSQPGGRRRKGGKSPGQPSTPRGASALAQGHVPAGSRVDCRVTVLRVILKALLHLGAAAVAAQSQSPTSAGHAQAAVMPADAIAATLKTVTMGTESKLPKALRLKLAQATAAQGSAGVGDVCVVDDSDDETEGGMPAAGSAGTNVYGSTGDAASRRSQHGDVGDDEEVVEELDELSAQLIAEFEAKEQADQEDEAADATVGRTGLPATVPPLVLAATLPRFRDAPMAVLMCHGGSFAGAIFAAGTALVHKSFTRYVVRKKQGGKQSSAGTGFGSAGSQIRKMQETRWREDVKRILDDWRPLLDCCWVIAYVAPGPQNRRILTDFSVDWEPRVASAVPPPAPELQRFLEASGGVFRPSDALKSPVDAVNDPRVVSAPLTTHKPTFAEVERVYAALRAVKVERIYRESNQ